jgi:hypothetical protein
MNTVSDVVSENNNNTTNTISDSSNLIVHSQPQNLLQYSTTTANLNPYNQHQTSRVNFVKNNTKSNNNKHPTPLSSSNEPQNSIISRIKKQNQQNFSSSNLNCSSMINYGSKFDGADELSVDLEEDGYCNESNREENYQRLSHSINDLFTNLLKEIEKQKNKEYIKSNATSLLGVEDYECDNNTHDNLYFVSKIASKQQKQQCSNDSNKDSGFNQDNSFYNNSNTSPKSKQNQQQEQQEQQNFNSIGKVGSGGVVHAHSPKSSSNLDSPPNLDQADSMSLLERYLNSGQIVAYKHTQIEVQLHTYFIKQNSFLIDNNDYYSMIEYILNQEGISLKTFKKLIREKYGNHVDWTDEILVKLFNIVNYDSNLNNVNLNSNENEVDESEEDENEQFQLNQINTEQKSVDLYLNQHAHNSPSPSHNSFKYHKRIKDLKNNSTNFKKKVKF